MVGFGLCHYDFSVREVVLPERDRVGVPAPAVDCATSPASAIATCDAEKARRLSTPPSNSRSGRELLRNRAPNSPSANAEPIKMAGRWRASRRMSGARATINYQSSSTEAATRIRLGSLVMPVRDWDMSSRASCVIRLSAISSSASDLLSSSATVGRPICPAIVLAVP